MRAFFGRRSYNLGAELLELGVITEAEVDHDARCLEFLLSKLPVSGETSRCSGCGEGVYQQEFCGVAGEVVEAANTFSWRLELVA